MSSPYPGFQQGSDAHFEAGHEQVPADGQSIGSLISDIAADVTKLLRQEVELAKSELRQEVDKAKKSGGMLAGAGLGAYMAALFLSLALMFGLGAVMPLGWAAVIVAVLWAIVGAVLYSSGKRRLREVSPVPQQTVETLKEDAQWLRNPSS